MMQSGQSGSHVNFKIAMLGVDMSSGDGIIGERNHGVRWVGVYPGVFPYMVLLSWLFTYVYLLYLHQDIPSTNAKKH